VLVVGYYAYLSGTHRTEQQEAVMSEIDTALSRNLENNYPSTPKEVVKYYNDLMKCFYNEDCTEEELQELGKKSLLDLMGTQGEQRRRILPHPSAGRSAEL